MHADGARRGVTGQAPLPIPFCSIPSTDAVALDAGLGDAVLHSDGIPVDIAAHASFTVETPAQRRMPGILETSCRTVPESSRDIDVRFVDLNICTQTVKGESLCQ